MEYRETLFQNEIEHLGKNFRLISAELILIQDFIKSEFGSKYLAFCNARREQQQQHRSFFFQSSTVPISQPQSTCPRKSERIQTRTDHCQQANPMQTEASQNCAELFQMDEEEPCIIPDGLEVSASESSEPEYDPLNLGELEGIDSNSEHEFSVEAKHVPDPPNEESMNLNGTEVTKKGGRPKSIIHRYFEKVQTEDGKWKDKCYTCGNFVSSKAPRLRKHVLKCRGKDSSVMKILNKLKVSNYTLSENDSRLGRKTDIVRMAFKEVTDAYGYNKMKCLNCGDLVSNKPLRMRNHLGKCSGRSTQEQLVFRQSSRSVEKGSEVIPVEMISSTVPLSVSQSQTSSAAITDSLALALSDNQLPSGDPETSSPTTYPSSSTTNDGDLWRPADEIGSFTIGQQEGGERYIISPSSTVVTK